MRCSAKGDGPPDQVHGDVIPPDLMGEDPQQVKGIGVVWLLGQNLSIEGFGLRKLPSLVVLQGDLQGFLDRLFAHAGQYPAQATRSQGGDITHAAILIEAHGSKIIKLPISAPLPGVCKAPASALAPRPPSVR